MICYLAVRAAASDPSVAASQLGVAIAEARRGAAEGGVPIGAAVFDGSGALLATGRNRCLQDDDFLLHAEVVAIRRSGRLSSYGDAVLVTTLAPCWYCSGLIRYLGFARVVVGDTVNFPTPALDWLRAAGIQVDERDSDECVSLLRAYIAAHPDAWYGDPGVATALRDQSDVSVERGVTSALDR